MADEILHSPGEELVPRPPLEEDLVNLCRELNDRGARYIVVGGLAIIQAGLARATELLWRMKRRTHREKDAGDLLFLRKWFEAEGRTPPDD